jgi:hypothetical protein
VKKRHVPDAGGRGAEDDVVARDAHAARESRPDQGRRVGDVTIFDLDSCRIARRTTSRWLFPKGIDYVLVNGVVTIEHGEAQTGAKAGKGALRARKELKRL